jgi:DNA topoisomerase-3
MVVVLPPPLTPTTMKTNGFVCEKSQAGKRPCKFSVSRVILQQPIEAEQLQKLLGGARTDLLKEFVSAKTGRPFQAHLVLDAKGKVTFEFPPRETGAVEDKR